MATENSKTLAPNAAVQLSIEFGQKRMSLEQVAGLTDGSILDFGKVSFENVLLRAGERAVALGTLVEIGEGVGFKITEVL